MYKIFADDMLIYDSTIEDYKIGKGTVTLEAGKTGSFVFTLYPDHFYYDRFVKLRTVVTVYKDSRIVFRGRVLNDAVDYWNVKTLTCEGELGFLNDSIIRPEKFSNTPQKVFAGHIERHNEQVDEFKRFKVGDVTANNNGAYNFVVPADSNYVSTMTALSDRVVSKFPSAYLHITHGDDDTDLTPTIHLLSDFDKVATQSIEFGENLTNYAKTAKADTLATAVIAFGKDKMTMKGLNWGYDYVHNEAGVAMYGWIFKTVEFPDIEDKDVLREAAVEYLESACTQVVSVELNALDLHLFDKSIDSFRVCEYIRVSSAPHNFKATLLCQKQTLDLLKPENDAVVLGATYSYFTDKSNKVAMTVNKVSDTQSSVTQEVTQTVTDLTVRLETLEQSGSAPSDKLLMTDTMTGANYRVEIVNGEIVISAEEETPMDSLT